MPSVLFIDDDAVEIEPLEYELGSMGVTVMVLDSVTEARERLIERGEAFDLVVVDVVMATENAYTKEESESGTLTGVRLIEELRKRRPDLRVATLTIRGDAPMLEALEALGVRERFRKPYFTLPLAQRILRILGDRRQDSGSEIS